MDDHTTVKDVLNLLDQKFGLKFKKKTGMSLKEALKRFDEKRYSRVSQTLNPIPLTSHSLEYLF